MGGCSSVTEEPSIHPGRVLLDEVMQPLGVSRARLARDIDVPIDRLRALIMGNSRISADMALRLGKHFGTRAELWMKLQTDYDLAVARAGAWQRVESRIRVLGVATEQPPGDDDGVARPVPEQEPRRSLPRLEIAANENQSLEREGPTAAEIAEPVAMTQSDGEEEPPLELTERVDAPDAEDEEPLELTERVDPVDARKVERAMGIEPTTFSLGS